MTKHRKIDSARDRARKIQNSVPFSNQRTELNPDTQEVRLVHHGQRWPGPDEPIDEQSVLLALQRGNQTKARLIVGRYLREGVRFANRPRGENNRLRLPLDQTSISVRVLAYLADMIDPPEDCVLPFIFEFRQHSDEIYKLGRYAEIGRYYLRVLETLRKENKRERGLSESAVATTSEDLGVSRTEVFRGLRVIRGRDAENRCTPKRNAGVTSQRKKRHTI
jgi:hypothetical protein